MIYHTTSNGPVELHPRVSFCLDPKNVSSNLRVILLLKKKNIKRTKKVHQRLLSLSWWSIRHQLQSFLLQHMLPMKWHISSRRPLPLQEFLSELFMLRCRQIKLNKTKNFKPHNKNLPFWAWFVSPNLHVQVCHNHQDPMCTIHQRNWLQHCEHFHKQYHGFFLISSPEQAGVFRSFWRVEMNVLLVI